MLIIDMPMPKDCPMCPMAHYNKLDEFTGCEVAAGKLFAATRDKEYENSVGRPDWCPIKGEISEIELMHLEEERAFVVRTEKGEAMNSRAKGKRGELELAKVLREHGYDAHRGQQYKGGADSPDVEGIPGYHIEVKRVERLDLDAAMEQSIRDAGENVPLVAHRKNRGEWLVTMRLKDYIDLERRSHG